LDYWGGEGGTRGNVSLIRMAKDIAQQAESGLDICAVPLEYSLADRGTFLKDAAVLAGMGVIGKNNLLITPEYGPRVRLRALALDTELPATECQEEFDPCSSCAMPCRRVCPQAAFAGDRFDRSMCEIQMRIDESAPLKSADGYCVSYCRKCELACPIGEIEAAGTARPTTPREGTDAPPVS
jgi:epoxyqueuosine reductase